MRNIFAAALLMSLIIMAGCGETPVPRPAGYFRIDLPEKGYVHFDSPCSYAIEYPQYAVVNPHPGGASDTCWMDIEFPSLKAKIHLTYFDIRNNLASLTEISRDMAYRHTIRAEAIDEKLWANDSSRVYGILYDLKGNTASAVQFFVTDSTRHYLRGSLYFMAQPNEDSLMPVINFLREDIIHLIETLNWR
ncbi:MAG: gliding motility lipoprotein GldD [Bacteroidales bacterium]|jgi:gliding motility-associated lipoprotein GldD|nr:gliding motility lipoprotein GldD [Bacteroidales bacterium]